MERERWLLTAKKADFEGWARRLGIQPVTARIIRNRDLTEEAQVKKFLQGSLQDCYSPWLLKDMDKAADLLLGDVERHRRIRVIGDYDVDGICSAYILTKGLRLLGAVADTAIPHRIHDGYGLNDHLIDEAAADGIQTIVTCDNGIAAAPQIERAKEAGITVIVTDHHEVPFCGEGEERRELLPPANAVIDPKQEQCSYPFPGICGAVVAYKLVQALAEKEGGGKLDGALGELLQFAALATVCDVMELKDENRILVKEGLRRLRTTENQGLRALAEVNGVELAKLSAYHLGFVLGPCLNATGRLDTALRALELLDSGNRNEAMSAARELKDLNDSRKNLTLEGVEQAEAYIKAKGIAGDKVLLIYLPEVHESLAGIIAGRVREKHNRPVFVLTRGEEGVKGSGRSIEGYHMYEAMTAVKHFFTRFGGHKMAAGLSMEESGIEPLRQALNEGCLLTEEDFRPVVRIDVDLPIAVAGKELAKELEVLEPFGVGNPRPLFAQKRVHFLGGRKMGAKQNCARFRVKVPGGSGTEDFVPAELLFFGDLERFESFLEERFGPGSGEKLFTSACDFELSVTYQLGINAYRGREELQLVMQNYC